MAAARPPRDGDPLGRLANRYDTKTKALAYMAGGVAMVVAGGAIAALRNPIAQANLLFNTAEPYLWTGLALAALGLVTTGFGALYLGKSFEVRTRGVRYSSRGSVTDIEWRDVRRLKVWKTVHVQGGRVKKTTWRVLIAAKREEIRLSESFLSLVSNVPSLLKLIEVNSGVEFQHVGAGAPKADDDEIEAGMSADELIRRANGTGRRR